MDTATALEPDVVVACPSDPGGPRLVGPPLLVAEILSHDSALGDLNLKLAAYERYRVPCYWVVDPDLGRPALRAFELSGGAYRQVARVVGDQAFHAKKPFAVQVVPSGLVAKLRPA